MSGIPVRCRCGQQFIASVERAGQVLPCPVCQTPLPIPSLAPKPSADQPSLGDAAKPSSLSAGTSSPSPAHAAPAPHARSPQIPIATPVDPENSSSAPAPSPRQRGTFAAFFLGPDLPPYRAQTHEPLIKAFFALILLVAFIGLSSVFVLDAAVAMWRTDGGSFGRISGSAILLLVGFFYLATALLEWRWFFHLRRSRYVRSLLGDAWARWFYVGIGVCFLLIPTALSTRAISHGIANGRSDASNPDARRTTVSDLPSDSDQPSVLAARPGSSKTPVAGPPPIDPYRSTNPNLSSQPQSVGPGIVDFMSGDDNRIAVANARGQPGKQPITLHDLATNTPIASTDIGTRATLKAISPTGQRFVFFKFGSPIQLEVRNCDQPDVTETNLVVDKANTLHMIYFEDDTHLFVSTNQHQLQRIALPSGTIVAEEKCGPIIHKTPGGNYLLESGRGNLHFRDAQTWERVGTLPLGNKSLDHRTAGISRDGRYLAIYGNTFGGTSMDEVTVWDLSDGTELFACAVPRAHVPRLRWLSADYLQCGESVVSIPERAYIARIPELRALVLGPEHQYWRSKNTNGTATTWPEPIDSGTIGDQLRQATALLQTLLSPGDTITFNLQLRANPPTTELRTELEQALANNVQQAGLKIGKGACRLNVLVTDESLGGTVEFKEYLQTRRQDGSTRQQPTRSHIVPKQQLTVLYTITRNGKRLWEHRRRYTTSNLLQREQTIPRHVRITPRYILQQRWQPLLASLRQVRVPNRLSELRNQPSEP